MKQDRILLRTLMHAFSWVDDALQEHMQREAGFSLPRSQSMIMICVSEGVVNPTSLSKVLNVSKQAIHQSLRPMVEKGLVEVVDDSRNARSKVVKITKSGQAMRKVAVAGIETIERELVNRIGADRVEALHDVLNLDWGPPPGRGPDSLDNSAR